MKKQLGIMIRDIRNKFGSLGIAPFFIKALLEQRKLIRSYPEAYREALKIRKETAKEVTLLIAFFNVVARKESREDAYEFVKGIFHKIAVHSMPAVYQIDELIQCDSYPLRIALNQAALKFMNSQEDRAICVARDLFLQRNPSVAEHWKQADPGLEVSEPNVGPEGEGEAS